MNINKAGKKNWWQTLKMFLNRNKLQLNRFKLLELLLVLLCEVLTLVKLKYKWSVNM